MARGKSLVLIGKQKRYLRTMGNEMDPIL